ncbi:MAG: hypothetical protein ACI37S_06330 [Candidatus Gastranaerophilaceae bacterium]
MLKSEKSKILYIGVRVSNYDRGMIMAVKDLKLNDQTVDDAVVPTVEQPEFVDRSDVLFSYMNMIAYNNKVDLKLQ